MKLFVRAASLPQERRRLTELLSRNLPDLDHDERFDWMYRQNPAGPGRTWFVCTGEEDHVVGAASIFPRSVWIDGKQHVCAQVGDFAVDSAHRSLGPALMLQKATLEPVDRGEFAFCYDCPPHDRGMATFQRLGLAPVCRMARFARLLGARNVVRRKVPGGPLVQVPLSLLADGLLRLTDVGSGGPKDVDIVPHEGPFGEDFSLLDDRLAASEHGIVRSRRHADELNWRYRLHPSNSYEVVSARRPGSVLGFAVYRIQRDRARLFEVSSSSNAIHRTLLLAAARAARSAGASTMDLLSVGEPSEAALARRARFRYRADAERVVVYATAPVQALLAAAAWKWGASDVMA